MEGANMLENVLKQAKITFRKVIATFRGVSCEQCGSLNLARTYWEYVDPWIIPDALYFNNSVAKHLGVKWAEAVYLKEPGGDLFTTREERYHCYDCGNDFETQREFTRTGE